MRTSVCLYTGVSSRQPQDVRSFRHNAGGIVLINGYIISLRGDD